MFACLANVFNKIALYVAAPNAHLRENRYVARQACRRQVRYTQPRLERLEDRVVPAVDTFIGPTGGAWTDIANWDLNMVPGSMDTAVIPGGASCVLSGQTDQTVAGLTVNGSLTINGAKLSITTGTSAAGSVFNVGNGSELHILSAMDFAGSGTVNGRIDANASTVTFDTGSAMVLGTGTNLTGSGVFSVLGALGCSAPISQSATIALYAGASITGSGSIDDWGEFDWNGGTLGLTGGVTLESTADFKTQGASAKELSAGTITNMALSTDLGGTGTLTIDSGATFDIAAGTVDVSLPAIAAGGTFYGGTFQNDANGTVDFKAPSSSPTGIGCNFINTGTLEVDDAAAVEIVVGQVPGGVFNLDGTLKLGGDLILAGTVSSPTGLVENAGAGKLLIGTSTGQAGGLSVASGYSIVMGGNIEVTGTGNLYGDGTLYNNGTLTLDLGAGTGIGAYQETSIGTLDLMATSATSYASLFVTGHAQLSGGLKIDGYTPAVGDSFTVVTAGSIGAHFDALPRKMVETDGSTTVTVTQLPDTP